MIGRLNHDAKEVIIIGAGISGLLAGYRLLKSGYSVNILEAASRAGGLITTYHTVYGQAEAAAHSIRSSPEILELFKDLNLPYVRAKTSKKNICRNGKFLGNPLTPTEIFRALYHAVTQKSDGQNKTLAQWGTLHAGTAVVDNVFTPLAHGIYAAEPENLDQELAFPRLSVPEGKTLLQKLFLPKNKSEKPFVLAPRDGMESLVRALVNFITAHPNGRIDYHHRVDTLPDAPNVVVCTPAPIAAKILNIDALSNVEYSPMISVTVFVNRAQLDIKPSIGVLMARGDDDKLLGILFNSETFDNRAADPSIASLTVMLRAKYMDASDQEIETVITAELARLTGLKGKILSYVIQRWPHAIPLYSTSLKNTLQTLEKSWEGTQGKILFANYTGEVSIRGMCQSSLQLVNGINNAG